MKQLFSLLALSLGMMTAAQAQDASGKFSQQYPGGVAQADVEAFCRAQLPRLCQGTTFEVSRDVTDQYGTRHITLQQYVDGVKADGRQMLVHQRDGKIVSVNGLVVTQQMIPASAQQAPVRQAQEGREIILFVKDGVAHQAYQTVKGTQRLTIDAKTGEVLARKSIYRHWDVSKGETVKAKGLTIFNGEQEFNATRLEDGTYALVDTERKLFTLDASYQAFRRNGLSDAEISSFGEVQGPIASEEEYNEFIANQTLAMIANSDLFVSDTPEWLSEDLVASIDSICHTITDFENSPLAGQKIFGLYLDEEGQVVMSTDTVLVTEVQPTVMHLPQTLCFDSEAYAFAFYAYNPETEESKIYAELPPTFSCNAFSAPLTSVQEPQSEEEYEKMQSEIARIGVLNFIHQANGTAPLSDIHWGMTQVLDYYKNTFGYDSFDGQGTEVYCLVNAPENAGAFSNAFAQPMGEGFPGIMYFGLGGFIQDMFLPPFVILPIMGHEFTHLVARNLNAQMPDTLDMVSGALDESFADIMGFAINRSVTGHKSWSIGEEFGFVSRRFDVPEDCQAPGPSCFLDPFYDVEEFENHNNACVQNHMFYLLCTGGEGTNSLAQPYAVTPMDITEAEALAFNTLTNYTVSEMSYPDACEAWKAAAAAMFGEDSAQLKSVCQAWAAVGLGEYTPDAIQQIGQGAQPEARRYNLQGQRQMGARGLMIEGNKVIFL